MFIAIENIFETLILSQRFSASNHARSDLLMKNWKKSTFFWLFNFSSTLKNPAQYKTIPNAEMVVEKEGKRWFWADVIFMRNNLN